MASPSASLKPSPLQQAAARELLARAATRESIAAYQAYMAESDHLDFQHPPASHHRLIIDELERLGPNQRLLIMAPPGSAKSTWASIVYPTWLLAGNPRLQILTCSHTTTLAEEFNRRRRQACLSPVWKRLSGCGLDPHAQGVSRFVTEEGGLMAAAGAGSAITGMRADVLVSDDLVSGQEQADSMGQLDKLWEWYLSDARTRLKPGGREVMIMTRWARRDPAGRILDLIESGDEDWTIIRLPMEAEEADPLGREYGDPLWPEWFTPMQVREAKRDPRRWSCLYQQRPLDESGAWVPSSAIEIVPKAPKVGPVVIGVDLALSVGKGDWSAMVACALDEQRNLIVLEVWRDRCAVQDLVERLFEWFDRWKPQIVDLDDDNASKVFRDLVRERGVLRGRAVPVRLVPMRGRDKETRAAPLRGAFLSDRVKIVTGRHDSDLRDEILSFPSGLHDDMIDALGLCARELVSKPAPRPPEEPRDTIKPRVVEKDGGLFLNHGLEDMWPDARGSDRI